MVPPARKLVLVIGLIFLIAEVTRLFFLNTLTLDSSSLIGFVLNDLLILKVHYVLFFAPLLGFFLSSKLNFSNQISHKKILAYGIFLFVLVFSFLALYQYYTFKLPGGDLATFNQGMHNSLSGYFLESDYSDGHVFAGHFYAIFFLLLPLYYILPFPPTLFLIQIVIVSTAAIPLFYIINFHFKDKTIALLSALSFLLYPSIQYDLLLGFHSVTLAIPVLFWIYYFFLTNKKYFLIIAWFVALTLEETVALTLVFFAMYLLNFKQYKRLGISLLLLSLIWFALAIWIIIPFFLGGDYLFFTPDAGGRYSHLGNSLQNIMKNVLTNPLLILYTLATVEKVVNFVLLMTPLLFFPLLGVKEWLIAIPNFFQNYLAKANQFRVSLYYDAPLVPLLYISTIASIKRIATSPPPWLSKNSKLSQSNLLKSLWLSIFIACLFSTFLFGPLFFSPLIYSPYVPPPTNFYSTDQIDSSIDHSILLWKVIQSVPKDAYIIGSGHVVDQISSRRYFSTFPDRFNEAEYVLIDSMNQYAVGWKDYPEFLDRLNSGVEFELLHSKDGIFLYKHI